MPVLIAIPKEALITEFIAKLPSIQDERWFAVDKGVTHEEWKGIVSTLRPGDAIRVGPEVSKDFLLEVAGLIPPFCGLRFNLGRGTQECIEIGEKLVENAYVAVPNEVFCDPLFFQAIPVRVGLAIPLNALARELCPVFTKLLKAGHCLVAPSVMPPEVLEACKQFKGSIRVLPSMVLSTELAEASSITILEKYFLPNCSVFAFHKDTQFDCIEAIVLSLPRSSCLCLPESLIESSKAKVIVKAALKVGVIIHCDPQVPFQAENVAILISDERRGYTVGKRNLQERNLADEDEPSAKRFPPLGLFNNSKNALPDDAQMGPDVPKMN